MHWLTTMGSLGKRFLPTFVKQMLECFAKNICKRVTRRLLERLGNYWLVQIGMLF